MTQEMTGTLKRQVEFREAFNQDAVGLPSLLSGSREIVLHNRRKKVRLLYRGRNNPPFQFEFHLTLSPAKIGCSSAGCLPILEAVMEE
jgi:hypothetical protein